LFFSGGDLKSVMARSGHAEIRTMAGYLHAAGGAMPASYIPEMDSAPLMPSLPAPGQTIDESPPTPTYGTAPLLKEATDGLLQGVEEKRLDVEQGLEDDRASKRARNREPFEAIAERWNAAGCPGERPAEIDAAMRAAYSRAYSTAKRKGKDAGQCLAAAKRARGHRLGAWVTAWRRWQRVNQSAAE
jgi:hypothetical protein